MQALSDFETVSYNYKSNAVVIIDQTILPNEVEFIELKTLEEVYEAIYLLKVRGAPAIGVAAAYGMAMAASYIEDNNSYEGFLSVFREKKAYLASSRPTAVNLFWALNRMEKVVTDNSQQSVGEIKKLLLAEADKIKEEDIRVCRRIGENGLTLIKDGFGILTHCNAGRLATVKYGTALSPIYVGLEKGYTFKVFTDETRPLLQGARLSSFELSSAGVDTTVICDNMASAVMQKGLIQAVFVGADRIAANGDAANKIGTSGVAILAKYYNIPFYVAAPLSTFDVNCASGKDIKIEERPAHEVTDMWYKMPMAPEGVKVFNPAFDVTPYDNITAIVTEYGVLKPPFDQGIKNMFLQTQSNHI